MDFSTRCPRVRDSCCCGLKKQKMGTSEDKCCLWMVSGRQAGKPTWRQAKVNTNLCRPRMRHMRSLIDEINFSKRLLHAGDFNCRDLLFAVSPRSFDRENSLRHLSKNSIFWSRLLGTPCFFSSDLLLSCPSPGTFTVLSCSDKNSSKRLPSNFVLPPHGAETKVCHDSPVQLLYLQAAAQKKHLVEGQHFAPQCGVKNTWYPKTTALGKRKNVSQNLWYFGWVFLFDSDRHVTKRVIWWTLGHWRTSCCRLSKSHHTAPGDVFRMMPLPL